MHGLDGVLCMPSVPVLASGLRACMLNLFLPLMSCLRIVLRTPSLLIEHAAVLSPALLFTGKPSGARGSLQGDGCNQDWTKLASPSGRLFVSPPALYYGEASGRELGTVLSAPFKTCSRPWGFHCN